MNIHHSIPSLLLVIVLAGCTPSAEENMSPREKEFLFFLETKVKEQTPFDFPVENNEDMDRIRELIQNEGWIKVDGLDGQIMDNSLSREEQLKRYANSIMELYCYLDGESAEYLQVDYIFGYNPEILIQLDGTNTVVGGILDEGSNETLVEIKLYKKKDPFEPILPKISRSETRAGIRGATDVESPR